MPYWFLFGYSLIHKRTNADPDPALFVSVLQDVNNKQFFCLLFLKVPYLYHFSKVKSHEEVTKH
jgi:hypothetical protein